MQETTGNHSIPRNRETSSDSSAEFCTINLMQSYIEVKISFFKLYYRLISYYIEELGHLLTIEELGHLLTSYIRIVHQSWETPVLCSLSQFWMGRFAWLCKVWGMIPHVPKICLFYGHFGVESVPDPLTHKEMTSWYHWGFRPTGVTSFCPNIWLCNTVAGL